MVGEELFSHFRLLSILGMWTPNFKKSFHYWVYYLWRTMIILFTTLFFVFEVVDLSEANGIEEMAQNCLLTAPWFCYMLKVAALLINRDKTIAMLNSLKLPSCTPKTSDEHKIITEYRNKAWLVWARYVAFCCCVNFSQVTAPAMKKNGIEERILPNNFRLPYGLENIGTYALTYVIVIFTVTVGMLLNITMDCLISGLMIVTCSQIELLKFKLSRLQDNPDDWKSCVEQHNVIFQFVESITGIFGTVLFVQCVSSMINIGSIILVISKSDSKTESVVSLFFLAVVSLQLLFYCWYGNQVFLKSESIARVAMDDTNWVTLSPQIKKGLLLVICRSQVPIEMKVGGMLTLSLDTYKMIMKASYSAYGMLRTMK